MEHTPHWKYRTARQLLGDAIGALCFTLFFALLVTVIYRKQRREDDIIATSVNKIVMVTHKHPSGGKNDPRKVYILDGVVPVGVVTSARWYFQTSVGYPALVKYSPKYHVYRQPYASARSDWGFLYFMSTMLFIMTIATIWAFTVWRKKLKENPDTAAPGLSLN